VTSSRQRTLLFVLAAAGYAAVFASFLVFERPGLGIGHFFYLPVALLALASGWRLGAIGGLVATAVYALALFLNTHTPSALPWEETLIRLVTFVGVGTLIGWYASTRRALVEELSRLATRDSLTGLPNTRSFENAIERRFAEKRAFALLLGDVDSLGRLNGELGRAGGDEALRRLSDQLVQAKRPDDEVARVGGDEFAILASLDGEDGRGVALQLERLLGATGITITFGWATYPREGRNALALYRAADERLYARKLAKGYRRGTELALLETS
jgi:diguanylate cyclase (GGDEF)-like protein